LEDACQALGAMRDGIRAGESGVATAFSFYPGKNLGAIGDAGALVTNDPVLADTARALREHGQRRKYEHDLEGYTARLDTVQAVVLLEKLPLLEQWNEARATVAARYCDELAGIGDLVLPPVPEGSDPVWHLFVIRTADPDALGASLAAHGIRTGRHYPTPVHMTKAYAHLGYAQGTFPVAEKLADECLSLPIFPELHESEVERVIAAISEHFGHG
jgi:dTDP-4-amino-4,6-dideoxygalactose transaminase